MTDTVNSPISDDRIILIDKPLTWTSFDAVKKIRGGLRIKKVGHAGTLDPLATGLLVICTGKFTKKIDEIQNGEKEYVCKMIVGKSTPSFDLETEVDKELPIDHITEELIREKVLTFVGEITQTPPAHSAIRINGQRAYELARQGIEPEMKSRIVTIRSIVIDAISLPEISITITCSKGTYIRSLVRDLGLALGSCAYMSYLRRTRIGHYLVSDALEPQHYIELHKSLIEAKDQ
jgi:tRNA pseudouridine55 synthase